MHILIVTQYFWPENFRVNDLVAELKSRGHQLTILTGKPNYPSGSLFPDYAASPERFQEYQGCRVVRVPMTMRGQLSARKLLTNYLSFVVSASFIGYWKLRKSDFDVIFVYEPSPVTVCLPALFFKKMKGIPVVFWVLDLWPETLEAIGVVKSPKLLAAVGKLVRFIYNRCDLVLGQSKAFLSGIAQYCDDQGKIKYFPSWSEGVFAVSAEDMSGTELAQDTWFKLVFAGNIGEAQDFPAILSAMQLIKTQGIQARLYVLGDGRAFEHVKQSIVELALQDYVVLLGRHPLEAMPAYYANADALLVTLKESKAFAMTIPGKVQSYMEAAKPLLTMLSGEGSRVVNEAACGLTANSGDYRQLAENIRALSLLPKAELDTLGVNAKSYAQHEFDRDRLISQLEQWFAAVADPNRVS